MPLIELHTTVRAPAERCFDLARSIDFHIVTAGPSRETAIAGRTRGLIEAGELVTWRARHFGVWQQLTVRLTALDRPRHFQDAMVRGAFAMMCHDHDFHESDGVTIMRDRFTFRSPLGPLGRLVDRWVLEPYLRRFLHERARMIREAAESDAWRAFLGAPIGE